MININLYGPIYSGVKLTFNSTKQRGKTVQGIAVHVDEVRKIVILRDTENFNHCVDEMYIQMIDNTKKGIPYKVIQK
jgi:hypothetical protein